MAKSVIKLSMAIVFKCLSDKLQEFPWWKVLLFHFKIKYFNIHIQHKYRLLVDFIFSFVGLFAFLNIKLLDRKIIKLI